MENKIASREPLARRRILIVDAHPLMRRGLTALIDSEPDLAVCAAVAGQREGLGAIASSRPELVIAGLSFDEVDGLGLVRDIRSNYRELPILLLTLHDAPRYIQRALHAGASGCVTKRDTAETLLTGIRCLLDEAKYVSSRIGAEASTRPREMLLKAILGFKQLALPEARLVERSIFNGLSPAKMPGHPAPHGKRCLISVSLAFQSAMGESPMHEWGSSPMRRPTQQGKLLTVAVGEAHLACCGSMAH